MIKAVMFNQQIMVCFMGEEQGTDWSDLVRAGGGRNSANLGTKLAGGVHQIF